MKIAVCSSGLTLDSPLDPRFGRCANFVVVDSDTSEVTCLPNPGVYSAQGAGIQAAQLIASKGVNAVIAGNFGPNAYMALSSAGIEIYTAAAGTVGDAVNQLLAGQLQRVTAPTAAAHSGMNSFIGPNSGQSIPRGMGGGFGRGRGRGRGQGGGGGRNF